MMNIYKYIELLKFYLTEKIDETNTVLKMTLSDEVDDIVTSIVSAIFSAYITSLLERSGIVTAVGFVLIIIPLYILLKFCIKKIRRYFKTRKEILSSDNDRLNKEDASNIISKFDHIACDGVIISRDFIKKYEAIKDDGSKHEKAFYLIEAFYYYKKSLNIVLSAVSHEKSCINNPNLSEGISLYRLINLHGSLEEIIKIINEHLEVCYFEYKDQMLHEIKKTADKNEKINKFIANKNESQN